MWEEERWEETWWSSMVLEKTITIACWSGFLLRKAMGAGRAAAQQSGGHEAGYQFYTEIERCSWCFSLWRRALWNRSPAKVLKEDKYVMCHWKWQRAFSLSCRSCSLRKRSWPRYLRFYCSQFIYEVLCTAILGRDSAEARLVFTGTSSHRVMQGGEGLQEASSSTCFSKQGQYWIWDALGSAPV